MKIVYLTAGAAGMFCGSCINDNAVAKCLIARGHDCLLVPVYTPIRTDEEDVSVDRVFMGGINVYLQQKLPWLAYLPSWVDGFLNQAWIINPLTKNAGKTSPKLLGPLAVSMLQGSQGRQRKEFGRLLEWLTHDVRPDTIVLTNLLIGGGIPQLRRKLSTKILVTLQGDDIFLDSLPGKYRTRAIELMQDLVPHVDGFITHSQDYAIRMGSMLKIPDSKIHVVPLGIETTQFQSDRNSEGPFRCGDKFTIGYLARMAPEKGLHRLVDAFISLSQRPNTSHVQLKLAGWMGAQHESFWREQQEKLAKAGLEERYEYVGSVDRHAKGTFLKSIDLFCVPTTYAEPKGLFLLEAVASGVPYIQPDHGAFPEIHRRLHIAAGHVDIGELFSASSQTELNERLYNRVLLGSQVKHAPKSLLDEIDIHRHASRIEEVLGRM